ADNVGCGVLADAVDVIQFRPGVAVMIVRGDHGIAPMLIAAIMSRQQAARDLADLRNPEGKDEAVEADMTPRVDGLFEMSRAQFAPAFAFGDFVVVEPENIGGRADQLFFPERGDVLFAEAFDVEGVARHEMDEAFDGLRAADQAAGATPRRLARLAHGEAVTDRAFLGEHERLAVLGTPVLHHADHLRDHVAGALHDHRVADPYILARDVVFVVQGRTPHHDAADGDGLEDSERRELAGATDIDADILELGLALLGGEFVRDRPARRARGETEPLLKLEIVDLV